MPKTPPTFEEQEEKQEMLRAFFGGGPQYSEDGRLYTPALYGCEHFSCRYCAGVPEHDGYHFCPFYEDHLECQCHICRHYDYDGTRCGHPAKRKI